MAAVASPPPAPALDNPVKLPNSAGDDNSLEVQEDSAAPGIPPTSEELQDIAKLEVGASDGTLQSFGSLFEKPGRHMIIFIRHFLCGMCQDFVTHLSQNMPPASLPTGTTLTIIGCGKPELISAYIERTKCPYTILSDPSRALYDAFGMTSNLEYGDQKPAYQTRSLATQITRSVWQGLTNWSAASKSGRPSQLGGEMLIETTSEGQSEVKWCHWMKNTRGHAEVDDLEKVIHSP